MNLGQSDLPCPLGELRSWHPLQESSCPAAWDPWFCPWGWAVGQQGGPYQLEQGQEGKMDTHRPCTEGVGKAPGCRGRARCIGPGRG